MTTDRISSYTSGKCVDLNRHLFKNKTSCQFFFFEQVIIHNHLLFTPGTALVLKCMVGGGGGGGNTIVGKAVLSITD